MLCVQNRKKLVAILVGIENRVHIINKYIEGMMSKLF